MSGYALRADKQGWRAVDGPEYLIDGETYSETIPEIVPSESELIDKFKLTIQKHMDDAAVSVGYDDIKTAVTYADEPAVRKFQAEGQALRAWRSVVWAYGYEQIAAVQSGARELPTPEQLITELPELVMP